MLLWLCWYYEIFLIWSWKPVKESVGYMEGVRWTWHDQEAKNISTIRTSIPATGVIIAYYASATEHIIWKSGGGGDKFRR